MTNLNIEKLNETLATIHSLINEIKRPIDNLNGELEELDMLVANIDMCPEEIELTRSIYDYYLELHTYNYLDELEKKLCELSKYVNK